MTSHPSRIDGLPAERRLEVLVHLRSCTGCRARWAQSDPTRLFALLATDEIPSSVLDEVASGVMAGVDSVAPATAGRWRTRIAGALAAGIVLALGIVWFSGDSPEIAQRTDAWEGAEEITPGATVVLLESPGDARVMDLTMGTTQVVMIFDQELDL